MANAHSKPEIQAINAQWFHRRGGRNENRGLAYCNGVCHRRNTAVVSGWNRHESRGHDEHDSRNAHHNDIYHADVGTLRNHTGCGAGCWRNEFGEIEGSNMSEVSQPDKVELERVSVLWGSP